MFGTVNSILGIGVSLFLRDNFSTNAARINRSFQGLSQNIQDRIRNQTGAIANMATATTAAGLGIMYGMRRATTEVDAFQRVLYKTQSITGNSVKEMKEMQRMALDLSYQYPYTATEIAESFLELSKAGIKGTADMKMMSKAVMGLATAADINIGGEEGATNMTLNMMAMFGEKIKDAEIVATKIAYAANLTTVSPVQLYESFKYAAPVLKQFNIGLDEALTLTSALAQAGIKGSLAGTTFSNFFRFMGDAVGNNQSKNQAKALATLGMTPADFKDANGNLKDRVLILRDLQRQLKGLSQFDKQFALETLFGVRGQRATLLMNFLDKNEALGSKSIGELAAKIGSIKDATELDKIVNIRMLQPAEQMKLWDKAMFDLKVSMVEVIQTGIVPLMHYITIFARKVAAFSHTGFGKLVIGAGIIGVVLTTVGAGILSLMANLALIRMSGGFTLFAQGGGLFRGIANMFQFVGRNLRGIWTFFAANGAMMSQTAGRWRFIASWGAALSRFFSGGMVAGIGRIIGLMGPWGRAIAVTIGVLGTLAALSDDVSGTFGKIGSWIYDIFHTIWIHTKWLASTIAAAFSMNPGGFALANAQLAKDKNTTVTQPSRVAAERKDVYMTDPSGNVVSSLNDLGKALGNKTEGDVVVNIVTPDGRVLSTQTINRETQRALVQQLGYKL